MPEKVIGGYTPLACPALDGLRMKAPEDDGSACAIEKLLNGLMWSSGCRGRRIKSIEMYSLSSSMEILRDAQVNVCI
jgi:hypothetical protein